MKKSKKSFQLAKLSHLARALQGLIIQDPSDFDLVAVVPQRPEGGDQRPGRRTFVLDAGEARNLCGVVVVVRVEEDPLVPIAAVHQVHRAAPGRALVVGARGQARGGGREVDHLPFSVLELVGAENGERKNGRSPGDTATDPQLRGQMEGLYTLFGRIAGRETGPSVNPLPVGTPEIRTHTYDGTVEAVKGYPHGFGKGVAEYAPISFPVFGSQIPQMGREATTTTPQKGKPPIRWGHNLTTPFDPVQDVQDLHGLVRAG